MVPANRQPGYWPIAADSYLNMYHNTTIHMGNKK